MKRKVKSKFKHSAAGLLALLLSLTPLATTSLFVAGFTLGATTLAQEANDTDVADAEKETADGAFKNVQVAVCNAAKALQGPVGIGIGFLVLVGGIIMVQVASRDALPMIARAAFGTALLLGAGAAFAAIVQQPCQVEGNAPTQEIVVAVSPEVPFSA